jgi:hypothetical protein
MYDTVKPANKSYNEIQPFRKNKVESDAESQSRINNNCNLFFILTVKKDGRECQIC